MCYEIVIFPIRKRHFRVRGWSGAFSEPLERKKDKTKCSYKICILLHPSNLKFCNQILILQQFFFLFCSIFRDLQDEHTFAPLESRLKSAKSCSFKAASRAKNTPRKKAREAFRTTRRNHRKAGVTRKAATTRGNHRM